jgi:hypothetical protein
VLSASKHHALCLIMLATTLLLGAGLLGCSEEGVGEPEPIAAPAEN